MKQGFTLLELSIVLVIIGLIIGGVTVGKDLIRAAELNSTVALVNEVKLATNAFKLKYNAMPGDIPTATDYGLHLNGAGVNTTCATSGAASYQGDGDGILESFRLDQANSYTAEIANYLIHMSNSGFLPQTIVGSKAANTHCDPVVGGRLIFEETHYLSTPVAGGLIVVSDILSRKQHFVLGGMGGSHSYAMQHANTATRFNDDLTSEQAKQIDDKLDDGEALSGKVQVASSTNGYRPHSTLTYGYVTFDDADSATNCVYNGDYNLSYETEACTLFVEAGR